MFSFIESESLHDRVFACVLLWKIYELRTKADGIAGGIINQEQRIDRWKV